MAEPALLTELPSFSTLQKFSADLESASIEQMFSGDKERTSDFTIQAAGLSLDYSKQLLSRKARSTLLRLGEEGQLKRRAAALLGGDPVNSSENRSALHSLLRATEGGALGEKFAQVAATRERMKNWADSLNHGQHRGYSGEKISDVVNIGIGGSDLGPRLVTEALKPFQGALNCHYVANVDPADLLDTLAGLSPASTLFIICSKSFRTEETLTNAHAAREWLLAESDSSGSLITDLDKHFLAITTNLEAAEEFGITADNCLPLWDWVGGRYSVWSAVGLSCAIALGWENFEQFLGGARAMDQHFADSEVETNMPMLMSLLEVWYCNFLGARTHVVLPYHQHLQRLPDFLQQLSMESNGKAVSDAGTSLDYHTGPILWGAAGTMGQHSFHQLLHQGTQLCPVDFILPLTTHTDMPAQHRMLIANCLAQSRALMVGRSLEEARATLLERGLSEHEAEQLAPHLAMPGNRPSSTVTMDALTPATLGALLALYEHRTFCSGQLWGINPFDQWGVELGKEIGTEILAELSGEKEGTKLDPSTAQLINTWRALQ